MKQLSGMDASFLHLETPEMPMHVGGLHLFDLPQGYQGDFYEDVKEHVKRRMHLADVFTKKLARMPLDLANPVWMKDRDVDLDYHIRRVTLPRPGTMAQLEGYIARLQPALLDRSRPLWQFYIIDGLQSGQVAFYTKLHHAALDGQGAHALAMAVLDLGPQPREVPPPEADAAGTQQPGAGELLGSALRHTIGQYWKMVKALPDAAKAVGSLMVPARGEDGKRRLGLARNLRLAPRTPLNVSITNQRAFASARIPFAEARAVAKAFDGTLNDAVMAVCSGALRRYLEGKRALPKKPLLAAVPVSLREQGNTELNNQVSMVLMNLATDHADAQERMREIVKASKAMKKTLGSVKSVLPTDFPGIGAPWWMSAMASFYGRTRLADTIPPLANVAISNVPGAPVPLYMAGARMASYFPVSIITHGLGLNITLQNYNGALDFGLIACRRVMPDVREFARFMLEAHQELLALAKAAAAAREAAGAAASTVEAMPAKEKAAGKRRATAADKAEIASLASLPQKKRRTKTAPKTAIREMETIAVAA